MCSFLKKNTNVKKIESSHNTKLKFNLFRITKDFLTPVVMIADLIAAGLQSG